MSSNNPEGSATTSMSQTAPQLTLLTLPSPSLDISHSRPYTAMTAASARTSFTAVEQVVGDNGNLSPTAEVAEVQVQSAEDEEYSRQGSIAHPAENQTEVEPVPQTPQTLLTFLLLSGLRRTMSFEPDTSIGRVKELVWNAWPSESEWQDERPPAPSYLRIIYLGKILQDDDDLTKLGFPSHIPSLPAAAVPTIVHLSIRAYAPPADEDTMKKGRRRRGRSVTDAGANGGVVAVVDGEGESSGCCSGCVVC